MAFTTISVEILPGKGSFPNFKSLSIRLNTILSPGETRWLSEEACVNRILEQREALIHTMLNNEMTVPLLEFTSYALNCFNKFNTLFQSASPKLHLLQERVSCLVKDFAQTFMHFKYVVDCCPSKIDLYLSTQFVALEKVFLGMAATESIKKTFAGKPTICNQTLPQFLYSSDFRDSKPVQLKWSFFELLS